MDTKIKAQLYDIVALANTEDSDKLVEVGNVRIREEDIEKYQNLQRQLDIAKPENQESPIANFPGTDVPKPRFRKHDESEEEYVQFLQEYYSVYFPEVKNQAVSKAPEKAVESEENLTPLASLKGDNVLVEDIDFEEEKKFEVEDTSKTEPSSNDQDTIEKAEIFDANTPLADLKGEFDYTDLEETEEKELTDEELEEMYDEMMQNIREEDKEDENFDILEESEIISIKNLPKKLWEKIKSIPFIEKAIKFLENLSTKNKKTKNTPLSEIEGESIDKEIEQEKGDYNEPVQSYASDEDLKSESKAHPKEDYNIEDSVDSAIINEVEPLTSDFNTPEELFSKVDNGSAYNYTDSEKVRIEQLKDSIALNPDIGGFFISNIIKKDKNGSIENIQSAKKEDLEHLIFEISNKNAPDYVFGRYSGKDIKELLVNKDKISPKAM